MDAISAIKRRLGRVLPSSLRRRLGLSTQWQWFHGDYLTWAEARAVSEGYDDDAVLRRILGAAREVVAGRAVWDRDGATFSEPKVNTPLLAELKKIAASVGGRLDVIDFGGGLGCTWRQHRRALGDCSTVRWRVVEQPHFVAAGAEFADEVLSFHRSLDDALRSGPSDVILLSSVLPYVEQPHALLADVARRGFAHVLIDRTPLAIDGRERLVVQRMPPQLGGWSCPSWIFDPARLVASLGSNFALAAEWPGFDDLDPAVKYRGFHLRWQPGSLAP